MTWFFLTFGLFVCYVLVIQIKMGVNVRFLNGREGEPILKEFEHFLFWLAPSSYVGF